MNYTIVCIDDQVCVADKDCKECAGIGFYFEASETDRVDVEVICTCVVTRDEAFYNLADSLEDVINFFTYHKVGPLEFAEWMRRAEERLNVYNILAEAATPKETNQ